MRTSMKLAELGNKIMLDRYAQKGNSYQLHGGERVIITTRGDGRTGFRRELGIVLEANQKLVKVELANGQIHERRPNEVDWPIESDYNEIIARVARAMASVEINQRHWRREFQWLLGIGSESISDVPFVPAGRIQAGAGVPDDVTLYNCYVLPNVPDSMDGIFAQLERMANIMRRGGGVGMCLSALRPMGAYVMGSAGTSRGSVEWGGLFSHVTGLISQGGSRIGALMLVLDMWHPDILDFIDCKLDMTKITNANISIGVSDAFMSALENDEDWNLEFPDTTHGAYDEFWDGDIEEWKSKGYPTIIYKTMKARDLWDRIAVSAHGCGDPGLWFRTRINDRSNSWYYAKLVCCNPCGEEPLPPDAVCNLGSLNLPSFLRIAKSGEHVVDWHMLRRAVCLAVRFMDNVVDVTPYHHKANEDRQKKERRIGLGKMGLGELLIRLGMEYGTDEAAAFTRELSKFITLAAYEYSVELAQEKGPFQRWDPIMLEKGFTKKLPEDLRESMREHGLRNVTLMSDAPTGSIGTMVNTSTGVEPFFAFNLSHGSNLGNHRFQVSWIEQLMDEDGSLPDFCVTAMDISPEGHIKMLAACQEWCDAGVSKTINMPEHATIEDVQEAYNLAYSLGCCSITVYRDNSRDVQVLNVEKTTEPAAPKPPSNCIECDTSEYCEI